MIMQPRRLLSSRPQVMRKMPHVHVASRRLESSSSSQAGAGGDNNFVKRLTLFKVAKDEDIEAVLKAYEILRSTALRVRTFPVGNRSTNAATSPHMDDSKIARPLPSCCSHVQCSVCSGVLLC